MGSYSCPPSREEIGRGWKSGGKAPFLSTPSLEMEATGLQCCEVPQPPSCGWSGLHLLATLCPVVLSVLSSAVEPEGACTGSAQADRPWAPGLSPFLGRLAGQVGADGLSVVERATCPAPPPQGLLGSGLRAWPGPECVSICVYWGREGLGLEAQHSRKICPSCSWEGLPGSFLALPSPSWPGSRRAIVPPAWLTPHPGPLSGS